MVPFGDVSAPRATCTLTPTRARVWNGEGQDYGAGRRGGGAPWERRRIRERAGKAGGRSAHVKGKAG